MRVKRNWDHVFPKNLDSISTKKKKKKAHEVIGP
jgi:hypothetical protein